LTGPLAVGGVTAAILVSVLAMAVPAFAGKAATGEPLFYPCAACHPVEPGEVEGGRALPNGFEGHRIVLEGHAVLGEGAAACLVCHDDPSRDPGKLIQIDGTLVDITGDVSSVCFRCHANMYREWEAGMHGNRQPKCSASGCHDPHTPGWISAEPLLPFVGTGFMAQVKPETALFVPLAGPPGNYPIETPPWLVTLSVLGVIVAGGLTGSLVRGRSKR
jgi:hypothetical protein